MYYRESIILKDANLNVKKALKTLENLFFPSVCEGCGKIGTYLCDRCVSKKIGIRKVQQCHVCKKEIKNEELRIKKAMVHRSCKSKTDLDGVFVVAQYSKFIEDYIGDIKYEFYFAMIKDLARVMNRALGSDSNFKKIIEESIVTFVPLNCARERWRGFNQAERIAVRMADYFDVDCHKLLKRVKKTKSQVGLARKERLKNLRGAFEFIGNIEDLKTLSVIVVDDVMTSGGTLEECARVLKDCGCRQVYGLVFARG